jgi:predicted transcriptional regulator
MAVNKRQGTIQKTPYTTTHNPALLYIHFIYKSSQSVRRQYELNTHAITILVACYLYSKYENVLFNQSAIVYYLNVYSSVRVKKYLRILVECSLLTQPVLNKYSLTNKGIESINEISHNSESLIYEFCNKYDLEL